jgi:PAT family acetyl-CoA transporter-like MFS transporter 1
MKELCFHPYLEGLPFGLISGSLPFVLKNHLSYSDLATLSLATYPYSLKLLWSPIVDAVYLPSVGRRKSWIIPSQILLLILLWISSYIVEKIVVEVRLHCRHLFT